MEKILKILGSKNPFRINPIKIADERYGDGYTKYNHLTKSGWKQYDKLIDIIYELENINVIPNANDAIEILDKIIDGDEC